MKRPGQYEAPLGITLRQLLNLSGGMREGHEYNWGYFFNRLAAVAEGRTVE